MAGSDYKHCDVCGSEVFYDAELNYDFENYPETGLYDLGALVCLRRDRLDTHKIIIEKKINRKKGRRWKMKTG